MKKGWGGRSYLPQWGLVRKLGLPALRHHLLNVTLQAPALILPVLVTALLSASVNGWFYVSWNLSSIANIFSAALTLTLYAAAAAEPGTLARKMRLTLSLAQLAPSYLHMNAFRLLPGAQRQQELVLYELLSRLYDAQAARAAPRPS